MANKKNGKSYFKISFFGQISTRTFVECEDSLKFYEYLKEQYGKENIGLIPCDEKGNVDKKTGGKK